MAAKKKTATKSAPKKASTKPARKVAKPAPARMTAKVSPLKGMAVAEWVRTMTSGWQTAYVTKLLALVAKAAPKATVAIKWGQPTFDHGGPFGYVKPAKAHVTMGFWRGAEIAELAQESGGGKMRHLKLFEKDAVDEKRILRLVKAAVQLNAQHGDPTKE